MDIFICFVKIETNYARNFNSNISGVKIGFPFRSYIKNNTFVPIEKSYVTYIVISIIFFVYSFYLIFIEMAYHIEDRKPVTGSYYMSDSPYNPSISVSVIMVLILLISLGYYPKSEIYYWCVCSIEVSNDIGSFQDAENLHRSPGAIFWGIMHFV